MTPQKNLLDDAMSDTSDLVGLGSAANYDFRGGSTARRRASGPGNSPPHNHPSHFQRPPRPSRGGGAFAAGLGIAPTFHPQSRGLPRDLKDKAGRSYDAGRNREDGRSLLDTADVLAPGAAGEIDAGCSDLDQALRAEQGSVVAAGCVQPAGTALREVLTFLQDRRKGRASEGRFAEARGRGRGGGRGRGRGPARPRVMSADAEDRGSDSNFLGLGGAAPTPSTPPPQAGRSTADSEAEAFLNAPSLAGSSQAGTGSDFLNAYVPGEASADESYGSFLGESSAEDSPARGVKSQRPPSAYQPEGSPRGVDSPDKRAAAVEDLDWKAAHPDPLPQAPTLMDSALAAAAAGHGEDPSAPGHGRIGQSRSRSEGSNVRGPADADTDADADADVEEDGEEDGSLVSVGRLKRAMGELVIQDDVIDRLQRELGETKADREELERKMELLQRQVEGGGGKGSDESAELLRLRLEDERLAWENVSLKRKLEEAVGGSAQNEDEMYGLKTELEKLRLEVRVKDDEIEQMRLQRRQESDARDAASFRLEMQEEDMRSLKAELADLKVGRSPSKTAPVEALQYRAEVVDLKLRLSDANTKLAEANSKMEEIQVKGGRDAGADFDKVRDQLQSERNARNALAAQLRSSHETEKSLSKSKDILEQRLKKEIHEKRNLSSGSFSADIDEFDDLMREKDEQIAKLHSELESLSKPPPINQNVFIATKEAEGEVVRLKDALKQSYTVADSLQEEIEELKDLLEEVEVGLNTSMGQIDSLAIENEDLKDLLKEAEQNAKLVDREINESANQGMDLHVECDSLRALLEETEREAAETRAKLEMDIQRLEKENQSNRTIGDGSPRSPKSQSRVEEALREQLFAIKKDLKSAEATKDQQERESRRQRKVEGELLEKNSILERKLAGVLIGVDKHVMHEAELSVSNVSLRSEGAAIKNRLSELSTQLTAVESKLAEKEETETNLRSAIEILRKRSALLMQHRGRNFPKCGLDLSGDPDDILEEEKEALAELLSAVNAESDEIVSYKEVEERLRESEEARLDAETRLALYQRQNRSSDSNGKVALQERLVKSIEAGEHLSQELGYLKEQLAKKGVYIVERPAAGRDTVPTDTSRIMKDYSEAKAILSRSQAVEADNEREIEELKGLLGQVARRQLDRDNGSSMLSTQESEGLNELSHKKLQEANAELKALISGRDEMAEHQMTIRGKCEDIIRILGVSEWDAGDGELDRYDR